MGGGGGGGGGGVIVTGSNLPTQSHSNSYLFIFGEFVANFLHDSIHKFLYSLLTTH